MREVETCRLCGHTWGVITEPRADVLCGPCGRPAPNRRPVHYWGLRATTGWPDLLHRSPEWWDQQAAIADIRYAAQLAEQQWPAVTRHHTPEGPR